MACICAVIGDETYIGSDSFIPSSFSLSPGLFVYKKFEYLIGVVSTPYSIYKIRSNFIPPKRSDHDTIEQHMSLKFFISFKSCLEQQEYAQAIIGVGKYLFLLDTLTGIIQCVDDYCAIGDGKGTALGSLYSTIGLPGYKRVALALSAANKHTYNVKPPYTILSTGLYAVSKYNQDFHSTMTEVDISALF